MSVEAEEIRKIKEFLDEDGVKYDGKSEKGEEDNKSSEKGFKERQDFQESLNDIEKIASQYGWKPEGKRNAEEYIKFALEQFPERGEALSKQARTIESKDSELGKMKAVLDELSSHMQKQKDLAYQKAVNDLQQKRKQAIVNGDIARVEQIDKEQINLQNKSSDKLKVVEDFKSRNREWMDGTSYDALEMQEWLLHRDNQLGSRKLDPVEHMRILEEHLHKKFPDYFGMSESKTNAIDGSAHNSNVVGRSGKKSFTVKDLTKEQRDVAEYLSAGGHLKISEYIQQLVDSGDLK